MPNLPSLLHKVKETSSILREIASKSGHFLIVSKPSADGITSAAIMARALMNSGGTFTIKYLDITSKIPASLKEFSTDHAILLSLGEDLARSVSKVLKTKFSVIDHHSYSGDIEGIIANKFGFKGSSELSSSTLSYLIAKEMMEDGKGLLGLSLAGSLGEHQDVCQKRMLCGLNEEILQEAIDAGFVELKERPLFPRLSNLPLHESIALSIDPLIQGLSGDPETVKAVLQKAGIKLTKDGKWKKFEDLSEEERVQVIDNIEPYLVIGGRKAGPLIANSYVLVREDEHTPLREGRDYGYLLESTMDDPALGTVVALGKRGREVEKATERMSKFLNKVISTSKSLVFDERRTKFSEKTVLLMGEGIVDHKIVNAVSYVASRLPTFSSVTTILRTTFGAEGLLVVRNGYEMNDRKNLYELITNVVKTQNVKIIGHEDYLFIVSSLIKQNTIIRELRKAIEA